MPIILNPKLYEKAKKIADEKYVKPSAYKSMFLVKTYKDMGGKYQDDGKERKLARWKNEEWADINPNKTKDSYPVYRPTKRMTRDTPLLASEIDPADLKKKSAKKQIIKGESNLEPFKKKGKTGGKITAPDLKGLLEQSYDSKNPRDYKNYEIDKSLSGERVQVYKRKDSNEVFVVHRGSQGLHDWANDVKAVSGYSISDSERFKHAEKIQKEAEKKYGKDNVSTLGHSLGSKIASDVGKDSKDIITLNKFVPPQDAIRNLVVGKPDNETNIRTTLDPVSALISGKIFTIPSTTRNPVTEHSTDVLERVDPNIEFGR